jgi:glutamine---fructose-6-phosphate transaminase (isomerizing)
MKALTHMEQEILSQPEVWRECLAGLKESRAVAEICAHTPANAEWLFIGCGSSYYNALAAAATFTGLGLPARAVPASELLLFPKLVLNSESQPRVAVLISRSGQTSEVLQAGEYLQGEAGVPCVAITCAADSPLEKLARFTLHLRAADECSTVMTRSFTSMLLGLQYLGARLQNDAKMCEAVEMLPSAVARLMPEQSRRLREFVTGHSFEDYVFLAQGPLVGISQECALKVTESSVSYAQSFHTMEFRHGPKSIVASHTLVGFLLSESGYEVERSVLEEVKELGGTTLAVANSADARTRAAADFLIELKLRFPEIVCLAAFVVWGQLLGLYTGLKKGLNPDEPRHLSRVVILNGNG